MHTRNPPPPGTISDYPQSSFYSNGGLLVRVVSAGELPQQWLYRPVSILKPGSKSAVSSGCFGQFEKGLDRVVTILKPDEQHSLLWAFKQDAWSDSKGESGLRNDYPGACKKITAPSLLREKMTEQKHRE